MMKSRGEQNVGNGDLILLGIAFLIGFISDNYGPQPYHYKNQIVIVDENYQCPKYCGVNHKHSVYFIGESDGMVIDKNQLGKKFKEKKKSSKK